MAQKQGTNPIEPAKQGSAVVALPHPHTSEATTAPAVPRAVAKQYGVHNEALHTEPVAVPPEQAEAATPAAELSDNPAIENPETDAAVDAIVSAESDQLLDAQTSIPSQEIQKPHGFGVKLKHFFKAWWRNKPARYITLGLLVLAIVTLSIVPATRYAVLNTFGVRSSASVIVLDDTTKLPLKNVHVSLGNLSASTNRQGKATLKDLKLGSYQLRIQRTAFASYKQDVTIGWGSNPLGKVQLRAVGSQYVIQVKDYFSGKSVQGAEAQSDAVNALADEKGKITLTVEDTDITELQVRVSAAGYRPEDMTLNADHTGAVSIALVPDKKTVYVSKERGTYDVYSSDLDGKNKKLLLAGTGLEGGNIGLVVSPDGSQAALVSTRDNSRDEDGYLLYALTLINIDDGTYQTVDHAQQIQLVDWLGGRLIYRSTIAGASAANSQRNRLLAYNGATNNRTQLAAANQFTMVLSANGYLYYGASSTDPKATLGLFRVKPDNSGRERLSDQEVWTGLRSSQEALTIQTPTGWYAFNLDSKKVSPTGAPPSFNTYMFVSNSKGATVWVDTRDGKGVLLLKSGSSTQTIVSQAGLTYPVRWVTDDILIYRVVTGAETADYIISPNGHPIPHKITDTTATHGYLQVS